jgi:pseudouridine kinase
VVDLIGSVSTYTKYHSSNPGTLRTSHGGVGRNVAESLARLGARVSLCTALALDANGRGLLDHSQRQGIDMSLTQVLHGADSELTSQGGVDSGAAAGAAAGASQQEGKKQSTVHATAVYNAIHDNKGELCIGLADMSIFDQINASYLSSSKIRNALRHVKVVVSDANISKEAFEALATSCQQANVPLFFEPTSDHKCLLPLLAGCMNKVRVALLLSKARIALLSRYL